LNKPRAAVLLATLAALTVLAAVPASAQTLTRGPLVQNPDGLTSTITLIWWTDVAGNSTVEYGTTTSLGQSKTVAQAGSCEIGAAGTCHTVQLTGLTAGTRYYYRLLTNGTPVLSTTYFEAFRSPADSRPLFFTIVGDFGAGSSSQTNVANNQNAADPPLVVTVGDNAYESGTQSDWDNNVFIPQYENLLRRAVFMPTLGNHDLNDVGASNWASSVEIKMHLLPRNAPSGQAERYYSFDYGDAHLIMLDSNPPALDSTQQAWLEADLAATTRKWKFVFLHHASHSCANGIASFGSNATVKSMFGPLFEQYGVDVVFEGHDHIYERSKPVDEFVVGGGSGSDGLKTIYVMTGAGGKTLDSPASSDSGGPYRQPLFGSKSYCPWISNECPGGVGGQYCSFATFSHTEVEITDNDTLTVSTINQSNGVLDTFTVTKGVTCGNGVLEGAEACDQGSANGTTGSCCTSTCTFKTNGTTCRASAGVCDPAESCSGSSALCPSDAKSTSVCRGALDLCDLAESCNGVSNTCPADLKVSAGNTCRAAAGDCDVAEVCDGINVACPANTLVFAGTTCRAASGQCDVAEACTGSSPTCPADVIATAGTTCRGSTGGCDPAETCNGVSTSCPNDVIAPSGTTCRAAVSVCDVAETCNGVSGACPADVVAPSGTSCRASAGVCDVAESCNGVSGACPTDGFVPSGTQCRAAVGICDAAESCTGSSAACPPDALAPSSTVCRASTAPCDAAENCTGSSNTCPADALATAGTVCRAAAGTCDVAETCDGSTTACPSDVLATAGTSCRAALGVCDVAEQCNGNDAQCPANGFEPASKVCRPAVDVCDQAETCTGSAATCPANVVAPSGTSCRASAGVCDIAETCNGVSTSCPADQLRPNGFTCRASAGVCDVAEVCTGSSAVCPADTGLPDGDGDGTCDVDDVCPLASDPSQADADGDGLGDACDPCSNFLAVVATKPQIQFAKLATPPGDDKLKITGSFKIPATPAIDPLSNQGMRIIVADSTGATVIDAKIPGGLYDPLNRVGWTTNVSTTSYTYRNAGVAQPLIAGINKITLKKSVKTPGLVTFTVTGKNGSYLVNTGHLPLSATIILAPPNAANNQCGELRFAGPAPRCIYAAGPGVLKCK
jgi:hypothetical protein